MIWLTKAKIGLAILSVLALAGLAIQCYRLAGQLSVSQAGAASLAHSLELARGQLDQERGRAVMLAGAVAAQTTALAAKVKRQEELENEKQKLLNDLDAALDAAPDIRAWADGPCPVCVPGRRLRL